MNTSAVGDQGTHPGSKAVETKIWITPLEKLDTHMPVASKAKRGRVDRKRTVCMIRGRNLALTTAHVPITTPPADPHCPILAGPMHPPVEESAAANAGRQYRRSSP